MSTRHDTTEAKLRWLAELGDEAAHAGAEKAVARQRERGKLLARERLEKLLDPGSFVELDRFVRHRETEFGMAENRPWGDAVVTGLRNDLRPQGVRLLAGLHRLRRLAERGVRGEGLQGDGSRGQVRLPGDRDQRLGWRPHPGGRRLAGRVRGDLLAQRAGLRRRAAALAGHGPLRRRCRLLAGDHRLRAHDRGLLVHVHHRARRGEDGHRRGGQLRGARRRHDARHAVGCRAPHGRGRGSRDRGRPLPAHVPAAEQPRVAAVRNAVRPGRSRSSRARHADPRLAQQAVRHEARHRGGDGRRRRSSRSSRSSRENIVCGFARLGGHAVGVVGNQPQRAGRRARHRRLGQGGALRAHLRRLQRAARHLRRRAGLPARARRRSGAGSSATAQSSSTRTRRPPCPSSP